VFDTLNTHLDAPFLGNGPGPETFLRGSAHRPSYFPPPIARSPMKSGLSGSPRRTPGLRSSPMPQSDQLSPSPSSGRQRRSRDPVRSERRPLNDRRPNTAPMPNGLRTKGKDKESTFVDDTAMDFSDADENYVTGITQGLPIEQHTDDVVLDEEDEEDDDLSVGVDEDIPMIDDPDVEEASPSILASATRKSRSENPRNTNGDPNNPSKLNTSGSEAFPPKRKRPGRPPKAQTNSNQDEVTHRPGKRQRPVESHTQDTSSTHLEVDKFVQDYANRTGPLKGRSLYILKRETPSDETTTHTRSGRVSVRPLAYWRNERCVYGDGEAGNGERYPLATIKEIIRTEELRPQNGGSRQHNSSHKRSRKGRSDDAESGNDEDDVRDRWEKKGVYHGYIRKWDPELQTSTSDTEYLGTDPFPRLRHFGTLINFLQISLTLRLGWRLVKSKTPTSVSPNCLVPRFWDPVSWNYRRVE
jgi:centromere protein C